MFDLRWWSRVLCDPTKIDRTGASRLQLLGVAQLGTCGGRAPQAGLLLVPVVDWLVGADSSASPPEDKAAALQRDPYDRWCLAHTAPRPRRDG
ncbi:hypothetical protein [Streptantibioticus ferralitis]|uniref:Uncharacterized protein n=1 Tax=Streptantibioticus ferralitis TaxID=236510 RepID=A0ABT5YVV0_9ACTN|nr:hypothetical protein [Streptantibioticus ferralitis]MDF2255674.1 hypothetical protein [Streptantibioticus ferralitis]